jgi:hypothetical protein
MDAIELLEHDHRVVEQLFRDYETAANDTQRRGVVEILIRELSKHAALEELTVYPFARRLMPGTAAEVHLDEHMDVKNLLAALDGLRSGDDREAGLVARLRREVEHHIRDEEARFLPALREAVDPPALEELGVRLAQVKRRAPTPPPPHAPDRPPRLALAAPIAAIYDRIRDRLRGRPRT